MKKNKFLFKIVATFIFIFFSILLSGNFSLAQNAKTPLEGLNQTAGTVEAYKAQVGESHENFLQTTAGQIVGTVLSFVGVLFLILMIYAGILWMTSQGNEQQVTKAKGLLVNGIIGIIIVFAAYALTSFIGTEILR